MTISPQVTGSHNGRFSTQPGSTPKSWNKQELNRCGAIGTTEPRDLNLQGEIHPVFANWAPDTDPALLRELRQPLRLASRLLEEAGLPWTSDFLAHDVFATHYAGRDPSSRCGFSGRSSPSPSPPPVGGGSVAVPPQTIVRHHRAPWATPEHACAWLGAARRRLEGPVTRALAWRLDADMYREKGWVGYTCRHPRGDLALDELDRPETIAWWDRRQGGRCRNLTLLVADEFPARLAELRSQGRECGEEYLLTAFMAAVTLLHELGHAIYWQDRRALPRDLREPYYGADLEMELGDSFVAAIFGGWVPVPVGDADRLREEGRFDFSDGVAWRQALSWDVHRLRPKYRAHYSIPVDYIANLFAETSWLEGEEAPVRPSTLEPCLSNLSISTPQASSYSSTGGYRHATAALADFCSAGRGWTWNRRPSAPFRIPQYDGHLCPDLDLPVATDDVIEEARARPPLQPAALLVPAKDRVALVDSHSSDTSAVDILYSPASYESSPESVREVSLDMFPQPPRGRGANLCTDNATTTTRKTGDGEGEEKKKVQPHHTPYFVVRLAKEDMEEQKQSDVRSPDRSEISLDELRCRLSQLLGVSFDELEKFFEASRCA
ncbi:hypothetical protein GGR52DRAFT_573017 [Hypoxylon sp. FL1284]|nr:hypothetical protein GGR52DRAFT_573017 [Hypoxylon sp. FL1284]